MGQPECCSLPRNNVFVRVLFVLALTLLVINHFIWKNNSNVAHNNNNSVASKNDNSATSGKRYTIKRVRTVNTKLLRHQYGSAPSSKRSVIDGGGEQNRDNKFRWPKGEFWNRKRGDCQNWGVATTIFPPTDAVEHFASLAGWCLVVAGDRKGPESYEIPNAKGQVVFLSRERQEELGQHMEFVQQIPWNHFARKNVAYLYAIANQAKFIWDFDDDNILQFNESLSRYTEAGLTTKVLQVFNRNASTCRVFNPYPFYQPSESGSVWPRGFPLDKIKAEDCQLSRQYCTHSHVPSSKIGIFQSIANKDPDVDAIYRLTRPLPLMFSGAVEDHPVVVPPDSMSPMNAQATLFAHVALWSLFLPTTVHGRVSDIWRSYIAQTLARKCDMLVTFVGPHVTQDRNAHTYLADLDAEQPLYERAGSLVSYLNEWEYLSHPEPTLESALEQLYVDLHEHGILEWKDVQLMQLWISSLQAVGYEFPTYNAFPNFDFLSSSDSCKDWIVPTISPPTKPRITSRSMQDQSLLDNVVLVGQFNYDMPAEIVSHWVDRWKAFFKYVDVRGPFSIENMDVLRRAGINAFLADNDKGYESPMTTMAESLKLYANNTAIRGVIMAHDDLLFNISYLMELGFPSDSIITTIGPSTYSTPLISVYANETFKVHGNGTLWPIADYDKVLPPWMHWKRTLYGAVDACRVAGTEKFLDDSGGLELCDHGLSDFLYVPTSMAVEFAEHANLMAKNRIMLEVGTPTILHRLWKQLNASIITLNVCTKYGKNKFRVTSWVPTCFAAWNDNNEYGIYHPIKLMRMGIEKWNVVFDAIVTNRSQQFLSDVECLSSQTNQTRSTTTNSNCAFY